MTEWIIAAVIGAVFVFVWCVLAAAKHADETMDDYFKEMGLPPTRKL